MKKYSDLCYVDGVRDGVKLFKRDKSLIDFIRIYCGVVESDYIKGLIDGYREFKQFPAWEVVN